MPIIKLKLGLIQMDRDSAFRGHPSEDPHKHICAFLEICGMVKINGITNDAIRLRLFPFSLQDRAKDWLESISSESIATGDALAQTFLSNFFLSSKTSKLRTEIGTFRQIDGEQFFETWEHYKNWENPNPDSAISYSSSATHSLPS